MVKFVGSDSAGLPLKRKQVAQACSLCRKRKVCYLYSSRHLASLIDHVAQKRCAHGSASLLHVGSDDVEGVSGMGDQPTTLPPPGIIGDGNTKSPSTVSSKTVSSKKDETATLGTRVSRFVGDMNPEGIFIEATSPHSSRDISIRGGVGIWQSQSPNKPYPVDAVSRKTSTLRSTIQGLLEPHVRASCLPCCPPASDFAVLRRIYADKLDHLFPAISNYLVRQPDGEVTQIVLQQVISLAAASDPEAVPHLRLQNRKGLLNRSEFSASLSSAIRITLDAGFITDRFALTRILLVFSMYMQPTCPEEADLPARAFSDATHQMHTLGLHLAADENREDFQSTRSLFCCLWALDRINSSLYGRALLIHERDIGWDMDASIAAQEPPFRLFLMTVDLLDKVIELYRPKNMMVQEAMVIELPIFEQMIIDAGATKVLSSFLGGFLILRTPLVSR